LSGNDFYPSGSVRNYAMVRHKTLKLFIFHFAVYRHLSEGIPSI